MRHLLPISVLVLTFAGCGSNRWCFWRGAERSDQGVCSECPACPSDSIRLDPVPFSQPPITELPMTGDRVIEYADPRVIPDNFRVIEPQVIESLPSNPDFEPVPVPTPDPAT